MELKGQEIVLPEDGIVDLPGVGFRGPLEITSPSKDDMNPVSKKEVDSAKSGIKLTDIYSGTLHRERFGPFTGDLEKIDGGNDIYLKDRGLGDSWSSKSRSLKTGIIDEIYSLTTSDIPSLNWNKIIGTGNSLSSYGILNGVNINSGLVTGNLRNPSHPTQNNDVITKKYLEDNLGNVSSTVSTGDILKHISEDTPDGYLRTNGALVRIDDYPELYSVIGTSYSNIGFGHGEPWKWLYYHECDLNISNLASSMEELGDIPLESGQFSSLIVTKNKIYLFSTGYSYPTIVHLDSSGDISYYEQSEHQDPLNSETGILVSHNRAYMVRLNTNGTSNMYSAPIDEEGYLGEFVSSNVNIPSVSYNAGRVIPFVTMTTKDHMLVYRGKAHVSTLGPDGTPSDFIEVYSNPAAMVGSPYVWTWLGGSITIGATERYNAHYDIHYRRIFSVNESTGAITVRDTKDGSYGTYHTNNGIVNVKSIYNNSTYRYFSLFLNTGNNVNRLYYNIERTTTSASTLGNGTSNVSTSIIPKGNSHGQCVVRNYIYSFYQKPNSVVGVQRYSLKVRSSDYSEHYDGRINLIGDTHFSLPDITDIGKMYSYIKT